MKLLAIRLSALGDVAMTLPVLESLKRANPLWDITLLSSPAAAQMAETLQLGIHVKAVNVKRDYDGVSGLNRLYGELREEHYDVVADLHDVLRSQYLRFRFFLNGIPTARIHKGRREKKALVSHTGLRQLTSGFERYRDVFLRLGIAGFPLDYHCPLSHDYDPTFTDIGIAPFAQHAGKVYPVPLMAEVIKGLLAKNENIRIFLFGGKNEREELAQLEISERVINLAGKGSIAEDMLRMKDLRCVISMDSFNMHLASLMETPVISVWGATHPYAGFLGYGQSEMQIVQLNDLPCRPCSIYGNKPCRYNDYHCLTGIQPSLILKKVYECLDSR
jgi:ADP-heptose:LPS heptosyltransferase